TTFDIPYFPEVSITDPCNCGGGNTASSNQIDTFTGNVVASALSGIGMGAGAVAGNSMSSRGMREFAPEYSTTEFRPSAVYVDGAYGTPAPTALEVDGVFYDTSALAAR